MFQVVGYRRYCGLCDGRGIFSTQVLGLASCVPPPLPSLASTDLTNPCAVFMLELDPRMIILTPVRHRPRPPPPPLPSLPHLRYAHQRRQREFSLALATQGGGLTIALPTDTTRGGDHDIDNNRMMMMSTGAQDDDPHAHPPPAKRARPNDGVEGYRHLPVSAGISGGVLVVSEEVNNSFGPVHDIGGGGASGGGRGHDVDNFGSTSGGHGNGHDNQHVGETGSGNGHGVVGAGGHDQFGEGGGGGGGNHSGGSDGGGHDTVDATSAQFERGGGSGSRGQYGDGGSAGDCGMIVAGDVNDTFGGGGGDDHNNGNGTQNEYAEDGGHQTCDSSSAQASGGPASSRTAGTDESHGQAGGGPSSSHTADTDEGHGQFGGGGNSYHHAEGVVMASGNGHCVGDGGDDGCGDDGFAGGSDGRNQFGAASDVVDGADHYSEVVEVGEGSVDRDIGGIGGAGSNQLDDGGCADMDVSDQYDLNDINAGSGGDMPGVGNESGGHNQVCHVRDEMGHGHKNGQGGAGGDAGGEHDPFGGGGSGTYDIGGGGAGGGGDHEQFGDSTSRQDETADTGAGADTVGGHYSPGANDNGDGGSRYAGEIGGGGGGHDDDDDNGGHGQLGVGVGHCDDEESNGGDHFCSGGGRGSGGQDSDNEQLEDGVNTNDDSIHEQDEARGGRARGDGEGDAHEPLVESGGHHNDTTGDEFDGVPGDGGGSGSAVAHNTSGGHGADGFAHDEQRQQLDDAHCDSELEERDHRFEKRDAAVDCGTESGSNDLNGVETTMNIGVAVGNGDRLDGGVDCGNNMIGGEEDRGNEPVTGAAAAAACDRGDDDDAGTMMDVNTMAVLMLSEGMRRIVANSSNSPQEREEEGAHQTRERVHPPHEGE